MLGRPRCRRQKAALHLQPHGYTGDVYDDQDCSNSHESWLAKDDGEG